MDLEQLENDLSKKYAMNIASLINDKKYYNENTPLEQVLSFAIEKVFEDIDKEHELSVVKFELEIDESVICKLKLSKDFLKNYSYRNISIFIYKSLLSFKTFDLLMTGLTIEYNKPVQFNIIQRLGQKNCAYDLIQEDDFDDESNIK